MSFSAELSRQVAIVMPVGVLVSRLDDGTVCYANDAAADAFGAPVEQLIGFPSADLYVDSEYAAEVVEALERERRIAGRRVELKGPREAHSWARASHRLFSHDGVALVCTTLLHITECEASKGAPAAPRIPDSVLSALSQPALMLDGSLRVHCMNSAFCRTFGASVSESIGTHYRELSGGAWYEPRCEEVLVEVLSHGTPVVDFEVAPDIPGLGRRIVLLNAGRIAGPSNEGTLLLTVQDVTELRRRQETLITAASSARRAAKVSTERLAQTSRRLDNVLRNIPGIAYRCRNDEHWTMEFLSYGCRALTGYEPADLIENHERSYQELILDADRERVRGAVRAATAKNEPFQIEYRIRTKEGAVKWVWEQGVGVRDERDACAQAPELLEGIIHDITARRLSEQRQEKMESQLRASQRLESVGRLAGGIAHDFNNILTVIQSHAAFLGDEFREGDSGYEDVRSVTEAADRAARLTGQLLAFSRRQVQELQVLDLNEVVREVEAMIRRLIGEDIEVVAALSDDAVRAKGDLTQLEQVLVNLAVNARDAMPDGGTLTIATARVRVDDSSDVGQDEEVSPGDYVTLRVTDTGVGMDADTVSKVFEPFFTTKPRGRGTGLGLSTVFGIVKQSGGHIRVCSEAGRGTTFEVYLPEANAAETTVKTARTRPPVDLRGTETILLVDDEDALRKAAARMLERMGYLVLQGRNGEEALQTCERHSGPIDLLVTDMVMPKMGGKELAGRASALQPRMRVLFMTGYLEQPFRSDQMPPGAGALLRKPFTQETLLARVRETLESGSA